MKYINISWNNLQSILLLVTLIILLTKTVPPIVTVANSNVHLEPKYWQWLICQVKTEWPIVITWHDHMIYTIILYSIWCHWCYYPYSRLILRGKIFMDWIVKIFHGYILEDYIYLNRLRKHHFTRFEKFCDQNFEDRAQSVKALKYSPLEINPLYSTIGNYGNTAVLTW